MKNKTLLIATLIFFLLLNTTYYWEGYLGGWAMLAFLILFLAFIILALALLYHFSLAIKEKFIDRSRFILIAIMTVFLGLIVYKPSGIIDFEKFEGEDLFIAEAEGAANCMTTLKLKEHEKFYERNICFGIVENRGAYAIKNDTINFINSDSKKNIDYYKFGIIKPTTYKTSKILGDLVLYKSVDDRIPVTLYIIKNELKK